VILIDTNVLIYGFDPSSPFHSWALSVIRKALLMDGAAINPVILAEYLIGEKTPDTVLDRLTKMGFVILDLPAELSLRCASAYASYLENRRKHLATTPSKISLPDFFIGAHASILHLPLATVDLARYQTYFPELQLITPSPDSNH
jgi:predicted nucleic acid-binding protein